MAPVAEGVEFAFQMFTTLSPLPSTSPTCQAETVSPELLVTVPDMLQPLYQLVEVDNVSARLDEPLVPVLVVGGGDVGDVGFVGVVAVTVEQSPEIWKPKVVLAPGASVPL